VIGPKEVSRNLIKRDKEKSCQREDARRENSGKKVCGGCRGSSEISFVISSTG
jgi:hypothetical protein